MVACWCGAAAAAEPISLPVTRDNSIMCHPGETKLNDGARPQIRLKSWQHMMLTDLDAAMLRGKVVSKVVFHTHFTGDRDRYADCLRRVGFSAVAAAWGEGTGQGAPSEGGSCMVAAFYPDKLWAYPGSDICSVIFGQGFTICGSAEATPPDEKGWQTVEVDPRLVQACVAGISHGIIFYDDLGSDWSIQDNNVAHRLMPNRTVHSREQRAWAPFYEITIGGEDKDAPAAVGDLAVDATGLAAGELRLTWTAPPDALGYFVRYAEGGTFNWDAAAEAPRYLVPMAAKAGEKQSVILRDLKLDPQKKYVAGVRAVDAAGNAGPVSTTSGSPSNAAGTVSFTKRPAEFAHAPGELPAVAGLNVWVIDELDKVDAIRGRLIEKVPADYDVSNHLWSAADKTVHLRAARNEFIGFQIMLSGKADSVELGASEFSGGGDKITVCFSTQWYLPVGNDLLPDALVPFKEPISIPSKLQPIPQQKHQGIFVDLYVPHKTEPGSHTGTIEITADGEVLALKVAVDVAEFALPDELNFFCEMNSYRTPGPPAEREYYRLAHQHRTTLNHLPYSQSGNIRAGCAPGIVEGKLDWTDWDSRFGPYLDGSAFADLPRKGVPLTDFYLPLHENWPGSVFDHYNGGYWADSAFTPAYRQLFVDLSRQIAQHFRERRWTRTQFQCYLNNKNSYRKTARGSGSSPWILDEPVDQKDFAALAWFARAFKEGVEKTKGDVNLVFRLDISRPQWQRGSLDGLVGLTVVASGPFREYRRLVLDRARRNGEMVIVYGSPNSIEASNLDTLGWILNTWCGGADGVVPWNTMGEAGSWSKAAPLAVFYPADRFGYKGAYASLRLKAYRRGEQDVEYLTLLAKKAGWSREALARSIGAAAVLQAKININPAYAEDAGTVSFDGLTSESFWKLRTLVANELAGR